MTNRGIRLTARAFNSECDATISNVHWNNVDKMELRIEKAFKAINKLNESHQILISDKYLKLKLKELQLAYEYAKKKQEEKEEQQELKRQIRNENKLEEADYCSSSSFCCNKVKSSIYAKKCIYFIYLYLVYVK